MSPIDFDQPFVFAKLAKSQHLLDGLNYLTHFHAGRCIAYQRMLNAVYGGVLQPGCLEEVPYLPVRLFKHLLLKSVGDEQVVRKLTSSGTTSQQVSQIYLDQETAQLQVRALASIVAHFIGKQRLPMIIVDQRDLLTDRSAYNARAAGVLGFSNFGHHHFYLLDAEMQVDWSGLEQFLARYGDQPILLFGFTFIVWKYLYHASREAGRKFDLGDQSILVHGGGWKRLQDAQVDNATFKQALRQQLGICHIHNYYGMVEQVGSIFMECEWGLLHTPNFADVLIRDPITLQVMPFGEQGLIQVMSLLPRSYPGHSLLTEDLGAILGEDDCPCGRKGKYFRVDGRVPNVELRGCSDVRRI